MEGDNDSTKLALETVPQRMPLQKNSDNESDRSYGATDEMVNEYYCHKKSASKRVTIHAYPHNTTGSLVQNGKLINLPGSLEELFEIGSK